MLANTKNKSPFLLPFPSILLADCLITSSLDTIPLQDRGVHSRYKSLGTWRSSWVFLLLVCPHVNIPSSTIIPYIFSPVYTHLFFLAAFRGMWGLSSALTRDRTHSHYSGSTQSSSLDHQGSLCTHSLISTLVQASTFH